MCVCMCARSSKSHFLFAPGKTHCADECEFLHVLRVICQETNKRPFSLSIWHSNGSISFSPWLLLIMHRGRRELCGGSVCVLRAALVFFARGTSLRPIRRSRCFLLMLLFDICQQRRVMTLNGAVHLLRQRATHHSRLFNQHLSASRN
jgi:hypothetical protein